MAAIAAQSGTGNLVGWVPDSERLLWSGQPDQGLILTPALLKLNLVGALVLLLAATANTLLMSALGLFDGTVEEPRRMFYWVLYLGAFALGLYLTLGVHMRDAWRRGRTHYAVTEHAAFRREPGASVASWPLSPDTRIRLTGERRQCIWIASNESFEPVFRDLTDGHVVRELMQRVIEGQA